MRSIVLASLVFVVVTGAHGIARAQSAPPIKPGLWQIQTEREVDGQRQRMPDMSEHLKNMPPEARRQMEAMMKQRGVDMSSGNMNDMKVCLTRDSLDAEQWQRHQGTCKTDYLSRTASSWKWHTSCTDPAAETDGEAFFTSADAYTVKTATTMNVQGQSRITRMTLNSKWLGPDCGDVKPVTPPKP
jgi:Protein of unknown function (DUF3617)